MCDICPIVRHFGLIQSMVGEDNKNASYSCQVKLFKLQVHAVKALQCMGTTAYCLLYYWCCAKLS